MDYYLIVIITLLIIATIYLLSRKITLRKGNPKEAQSYSTDELILSTINSSKEIICKALDCIAESNTIEACKNLRIGSKILHTLRNKIGSTVDYNKPQKEHLSDYLDHMLESADRIAETSRNIVSSPNFTTTIADKCQIMTIRDSVAEILSNANNPDRIATSVSQASNQKDFLEHLISEHTKAMSHNDFNDNTYAYSHLMLLYHINAFISSFHRILHNYPSLPSASCQ